MAAFGFRHRSWFEEEVYQALVVADTGEEDGHPVGRPTAAYGYARLRKEAYEPGELTRWAEKFAVRGSVAIGDVSPRLFAWTVLREPSCCTFSRMRFAGESHQY